MVSSPDTAGARQGASDAADDSTGGSSPAGGPQGQVVRTGHLPVSEFLFDRPGAGSPYGEEVEFPLPVDGLTFQPADKQPIRDH